jgi:hypothetical protein
MDTPLLDDRRRPAALSTARSADNSNNREGRYKSGMSLSTQRDGHRSATSELDSLNLLAPGIQHLQADLGELDGPG